MRIIKRIKFLEFLFFLRSSVFVCGFIFLFSLAVTAQKIAVLVPEKSEHSQNFAGKLEMALSENLKILDSSMSETAFRSIKVENPFNLYKTEAKLIGAVVGCDYFLLVKSQTLRRASLSKPDYYESYAVVYVVSSRSGRLIFWKLNSFESEKEAEAEKSFFASVGNLSNEIANRIKTTEEEELKEKAPPKIAELPEESSPEAKNFRPPLPFKRVKPEYTLTANLYRVEATIDVLVDVGAEGKILRTEILRWAGYGLDESVTETVRKMQWRAAERAGIFLPMRVLLRYNFRKIEDEE